MKRYTILFLLLLVAWTSYGQFITNNGLAISNSIRVVTNGDWTNAAGSTIINNGLIETTESFVNDGMLDNASSGGFRLNYASDKNFQPGGSRITFLTKLGTGRALVTGTLSIKDSLRLGGGLLHLVNTSDTVSLRAGCVLLISPGSFVEGMLSRSGTGDLLFPVGVNGNFLPVTLYKANAKKLTASVVPAPANTAGPGVDAMIGFPYAWKIAEQANADTATFVEVSYSNTLPVVGNTILAREIPGGKVASMGARFFSNTNGMVTVRSYARGTKGVFTIAQGFPGNLATDSLALVALYNSTAGSGWITKTNWLTGDVSTWSGVTVTGQSITAINLSNNNLTGVVPDPLVDILALQNVNVSRNKITAIPNFSVNPQIQSLNVSENKLTFATLEPNAAVPGFAFLSQADFGTARNETLAVGSPVTFQGDAGGASSVYQWKRNGTNVPGANAPTYAVKSIDRNNMGEYMVEVTNPALPGLTLKSVPQKVLAHAEIAGKLLVTATQPATAGTMLLYRVTDSGRFAVVDTVSIANNGDYKFQQVVLDDYQIRGFADTLVHARALPTYYKSTIFWEEADTVSLENNLPTLDIVSAFEPLPPTGRGVISGKLEEGDESQGGRVQKGPVRNAGVSARRVENTGRGQAEVLTLVAYVFTDDNGEFQISNLPVGNYNLNIQYPGYPMDQNSDIVLTIGQALQSQVNVQATVTNGKISVRKLIITGLGDVESFGVKLYPNPAVDQINLSFESSSKGRLIDLTDLSGRRLLMQSAEGMEAQIDVSNVERGIYVLRIKDATTSAKTFKVVIE